MRNFGCAKNSTMDESRPIRNYFKGKNVFITGGSGFIGKALIEKLLRSCPEIMNIYVLLRPKKEKILQERVEQILSNPLFEPLRKSNPDSFKKIIPINGDTAKIGLGLSSEDRQLLTENTHIFYHAAASVRFDDFLKEAIFINVRSAREAANLALDMKKIEIFMHVSTTYCNIDNKKVIEEVLYPPHGDWKEAIAVAESCDTQTLNILSRKYIGTFPNTYTFTKLLAEHCINDLLVGKVPTVICRPSVVVSAIVEPFPGWIDNLNGPTGLLLAGGTGLLRVVYGEPTNDTDYMAVDNVVKFMIVAAWHKATSQDSKVLSVYHASKYNIIHAEQSILLEMGKRLYWDVPFEKKIWFPGNSMTKCWYNYYINVLLFHMFPAVILDLLLRVFGYPATIFKIQRKIYIANMAVSHFMLNEWMFVNEKALSLKDAISPKEKEEFNFMVSPVGEEMMYEYYRDSCDHARKYLLKECKNISEETRIRTRRMYYLDRFVKWVSVGLAVWLILFKADILRVALTILCDYWNRV